MTTEAIITVVVALLGVIVEWHRRRWKKDDAKDEKNKNLIANRKKLKAEILKAGKSGDIRRFLRLVKYGLPEDEAIDTDTGSVLRSNRGRGPDHDAGG